MDLSETRNACHSEHISLCHTQIEIQRCWASRASRQRFGSSPFGKSRPWTSGRCAPLSLLSAHNHALQAYASGRPAISSIVEDCEQPYGDAYLNPDAQEADSTVCTSPAAPHLSQCSSTLQGSGGNSTLQISSTPSQTKPSDPKTLPTRA